MKSSPLDALLADYEDRQQEQTRRMVQRALQLEADREEGAGQLRRGPLEEGRHAAERLERAGHTVSWEEFLEGYPPGVRLHLWPRPGPMEVDEPRRVTLEFTWADPHPGMLCVRRWSTRGLGAAVEQAAARPGQIDPLWAREQLLDFVRIVLSGVDSRTP